MSIPERLTRIVRHKISEMKDKFDQMDEEALADPAEIERLKRAQARMSAKQELDDALASPASSIITPDISAQAPRPDAQQRRTPQQIATGQTAGSTIGGSAPPPAVTLETPEALAFHYRTLGLEPGCDFTDVQNAYNNLAARTDPSRCVPGSPEAREMEDIRKRVETSYRALRDALDATAHRFGHLEI